MRSHHKKLILIAVAVALFGLIVMLVLNALGSNIALFKSPTEVSKGDFPKDSLFRIGGLVKEGSIVRQADGVTIRFVITDTESDITVDYVGILPDLFLEGKGAVAQGRLQPDGIFRAQEVLARHDENYMPAEAQHALNEAHARAQQNRAEFDAAAPSATTQPKASY